jgi:lipoprotein-releasing system permease protein
VYQALLTRRYLTSKVMPLLAVLAVLLCTAMVLIVWSVMSGFLGMLLASGRMLIGDVIVSWPVQGIPYYADLIDRLEDDPMVDAATGTIEAPGLLKLPDGSVELVSVVGVDGPDYNEVTGYYDSIWWRPLEKPLPRDEEREDPRLLPENAAALERAVEAAHTLTEADPLTGRPRPAVVLGVETTGYTRRNPGGWFVPQYRFMPEEEVTLSVLPLTGQGAVVGVEARTFPVANEFQSGLYEVDANQVFLRLDALQEMLRLNGAERVEDDFDFNAFGDEGFAEPEVVGREPARVTSVLVRAADGVTPNQLRERVAEIYRDFSRDTEEAPDAGLVPVITWEQRQGVATLVAAVKKETALVLVLFAFISLTAVFLVFAIFWAMVSEKVRDIGILRAMGASRLGVAWIFIRYGLAIGVTGSLLGGVAAHLIVWNINPIHDWLGRSLGLYVWDPSVYYFTVIPSDVDPAKAALVIAGGILFSVLGAIIPATKAANMDPVRALRWE